MSHNPQVGGSSPPAATKFACETENVLGDFCAAFRRSTCDCEPTRSMRRSRLPLERPIAAVEMLQEEPVLAASEAEAQARKEEQGAQGAFQTE